MTIEFTEWKLPTKTGDHSASGGTVQWFNHTAVTAKSDVYVKNTSVAYNGPINSSMPAGRLTHWLKTSGYGFVLPENAEVVNVHARFKARAPAGSVKVDKIILTVPHPFSDFRQETAKVVGNVLNSEFVEYEYSWPYTLLHTSANLDPRLANPIVTSEAFGSSFACSSISNGSKVEADSVEMRIEYKLPDPVEEPVDEDPEDHVEVPANWVEFLDGLSAALEDLRAAQTEAFDTIINSIDDFIVDNTEEPVVTE